MSKLPVGNRLVTAIADNTGNNTGNYTASFDPAEMNIHWTYYEVYKMVVNPNISGLVGWTVFIGQRQYEGFESLGVATWSDPHPMVVDSGETVYFYFNKPVTGNPPPTVGLWVQVDLDIAKQI